MLKPYLIAVTGRPGAGKSTFAHALGQRAFLPVISRDEIKEGYVHTFGKSHAELPEGAYYIADLLGLRVEDDEGAFLGRLEYVLQNGGVDVYQVSDGEKTILFPLAPGVELERDLEHGVIRVSAARLKEVAVHV